MLGAILLPTNGRTFVDDPDTSGTPVTK
jgi:hypothetical protein